MLWHGLLLVDWVSEEQKKSTPFAAQSVAETAVQKAASYGLREVHVFVKGPGMGRENAIRSLGAMGLRVKSIHDVTPIPHNGCRPRIHAVCNGN